MQAFKSFLLGVALIAGAAALAACGSGSVDSMIRASMDEDVIAASERLVAILVDEDREALLEMAHPMARAQFSTEGALEMLFAATPDTLPESQIFVQSDTSSYVRLNGGNGTQHDLKMALTFSETEVYLLTLTFRMIDDAPRVLYIGFESAPE